MAEPDRALANPLKTLLSNVERALPVGALVLMMLLPLAEAVVRKFWSTGIPGALPFVQHLTLWVAFLGAALAARENKLLSLATSELLPEGWIGRAAKILAGSVGALASALLFRASLTLVLNEREFGSELPLGVPVWVIQLALPVAFLLIAVRLMLRADETLPGRAVAAAGLLLGLLLGQYPGWVEGWPAWPGLVVLIAAAAAGMPIFALLGGTAVYLFLIAAEPAAAVPAETYRLTVSATLPAIPLFTLTGFVLAKGRSAGRLLRVFRALFGWVPGSTAVVTVVVCAFFTVFTGGSGVTILALGALLFTALREDHYRERFSLGLLTASGSLGLLFPPALPLILYGIVARVSIRDLFIGGLLPGVLMVTLMAAWGVREGLRRGAGRQRFAAREALSAAWLAKWELFLPVLVLVAIFGGFATLVEASALTALYAIVVEVVIHRDLRPGRQLFDVLTECVVLVGGVLIILGVAMGLTSYMVDAQVASRLVEWAEGSIGSKLVFLLALNLFLLGVGCLMDIFSAIVVVVPLIVPLGAAFGIDPIHLGIIFVANLELGYLTPPVGLNLFLAAYRFERPILTIWRAALAPLAILAVGVLLITYWPSLTLGLLEWIGRG